MYFIFREWNLKQGDRWKIEAEKAMNFNENFDIDLAHTHM